MIYVAAALAFLTFCIHTFSGGKAVAQPLIASTSIDAPVKWLSYYCWHIATLLLLSMTCAILWVGISGTPESGRPLIVFLSGLSAAMGLLSVWVAKKGSINPLKFPSTVLFALLAINLAIVIAGY